MSKNAAWTTAKADPPVKTGTLSLLAGVFKVPSKRTVTVWHDKIEYSLGGSKKNQVGVIRTQHAYVSPDGSKQFILRDRAQRADLVFVAKTPEEKDEWLKCLNEVIRARLALRQQALEQEKARMEAIAARLGVGTVTVSEPPKPPTIDEEDGKKLTAALEENTDNMEPVKPVDEPEPEACATTTTTTTTELSQEVRNAAAACGVDETVIGIPVSGVHGTVSGSGHGVVRLENDVYWYEVAPSDTLAGICLRFDAKEMNIRRANFLNKRRIDGMKVLRIPRHMTGDPAHDYSSTSAGCLGSPTLHTTEDPEIRRQRQESFQVRIMVLLSAQRALREEDCFSPKEAKAYLNLHDHDLNKALDAMEQDAEWDEKYGHLLRERQDRVRQQMAMRAAQKATGVSEVVVNALRVPDDLRTGGQPAPVSMEEIEMKPLASSVPAS